jgi:hypothetical protein
MTRLVRSASASSRPSTPGALRPSATPTWPSCGLSAGGSVCRGRGLTCARGAAPGHDGIRCRHIHLRQPVPPRVRRTPGTTEGRRIPSTNYAARKSAIACRPASWRILPPDLRPVRAARHLAHPQPTGQCTTRDPWRARVDSPAPSRGLLGSTAAKRDLGRCLPRATPKHPSQPKIDRWRFH